MPGKSKKGINLGTVSEDEREYFDRAARAAGHETRSGWMLFTLRKEAEKVLEERSPALISEHEQSTKKKK